MVARGTLVAPWPCGVVHAALTHTAAPPPTGLIYRLVKMAVLSMVVALTA